MANTVTIKLSKELEQLTDPAKARKLLIQANLEAGKFLLGRSTEQSGSKEIPPSTITRKQAPLARSFGPWVGAKNAHTKQFDEYTQDYENAKVDRSSTNFLVLDGHLYKDAILNAEIFANLTKIKITAKKGRSSKYAGAQQFGSKNTPARPFYLLTAQDMKDLSLFLTKRWLQIFKKG